jgi:D-tyrosyl-tRNA(Tyr) deacylase
VLRASVRVDGEVVGAIGAGLAVLVGVTHDDDARSVEKMADKLWNLRIFSDTAGAMNLSVAETTREILVVSQFTLYGDTRKGRRPSYMRAALPEVAEPLLDDLVAMLGELGASVATGRFRADMEVDLLNDGPVTLIVET